MPPKVAMADAGRLQDAIRGKAPFIVLLGGPEQAAALDEAVSGLDQVTATRIRNPLAAPLSLERVMLQLAPGGGDAAPGDDAERVLRAMATCSGGRPSLLVIVEQAQTLTAPALALLQLLPGLRQPGVPRIQVAFVGTPAFGTLLQDPRFQVIGAHPAGGLRAPAVAEAVAPLSAVRPAPRAAWLVGGLAALAAVATLVAMLPTAPVRTVPTALPAPASTATAVDLVPAQVDAAAPAPPAVATPASPPPAQAAGIQAAGTLSTAKDAAKPVQPAAPPLPSSLAPEALPEDAATARARLFREFNAFIEARGLSGRLAPSDRESLFQEYLTRRHAMAASQASPAPRTAAVDEPRPTPGPGRPEVVLFFQSGSVRSATLAADGEALLRTRVSGVTVQSTTDSPPIPTIRFYHAQDRDAALSLASAVPVPGMEWQVADMSGSADRPPPGRVEMWLPRLHGAP